MLRFLAVMAAGAFAVSAFGEPTDLSSRIIKPNSIGYKHAVYNTATGKLEPVGQGGVERIGAKIWSSNFNSGFFFPAGNCLQLDPSFDQIDAFLMDWGDIPAQQIGGFQIAYATDASTDPNAVECTILFQDNANGFNDNTGPITGFIAGLPGLPPGFPYQFVGWTVTFDLDLGGLDFPLGDLDLDADGLADFGYYYGFLGATGYGDSSYTGPQINGPNDPLFATGSEDSFDLYLQDPNNPCLDPNAGFFYQGTFWFGGAPYSNWHLQLFGSAAPGCNLPGCEDGDLDGDCIVGLSDLSDLLENFGCTSADACYDANADIDGDGTNGLSDLSALLEEFGTNCN